MLSKTQKVREKQRNVFVSFIYTSNWNQNTIVFSPISPFRVHKHQGRRDIINVNKQQTNSPVSITKESGEAGENDAL